MVYATTDGVPVPSAGVYEKGMSVLPACYRNSQETTSSLPLAKQVLRKKVIFSYLYFV